MQISVLLCTHNARADFLAETLAALQAQTLSRDEWELLVIDSASSPRVEIDLVAWHPQARVLRESRPGLTRARARGICEARATLLVFCDDDNLLRPDYLAQAVALFSSSAALGAAGGRSLPRYLRSPPSWLAPYAHLLAVRDLGDAERIVTWARVPRAERVYPACAPIGAGLVMRREIALAYVRNLDKAPAIPDRVGRQLSAGGDADMVLSTLEAGWAIGYLPQLELTHLIPEERVRLAYLARLNREGSTSWVQLLARHELSPWPPIPAWTVPWRQLRAFFAQQAWRGSANYFRWAGACGIFAGQARIGHHAPVSRSPVAEAYRA